MSDFQALGAQFRQAREEKELSLQDVEKKTRIRFKFLQAIEQGNFFVIDNPTQLKGFLRTYARTLDLDDVVILSQYEQALRYESRKGRGRKKNRRQNTSVEAPPQVLPGQRIVVEKPRINTANYPTESTVYQPESGNTGKVIVGGVLILVIVGMVIGAIVLVASDFFLGDEATPPVGVIQAINLASSPVVVPTATPTQNVQPTVVTTPNIVPGTPLDIQLVAQQRLWLRVQIDGVIDFEGLMRPGDALNYRPADTLIVTTSNAVGLQILVNSQPYILGTERVSATTTISVQNGISASIADTGRVVLQPTQQIVAQNPVTVAVQPSATVGNTLAPSATLPPSATPTSTLELPAGVAITSTSIPVFGFGTDTPTFTPSPVPPTATPTFTASPFLPERFTRTPIPEKN